MRGLAASDARCYGAPSLDRGVLERVMAAVCDVCGKKPSFGVTISHSHRRTKRRWNPNIQRVRAVVGGSVKRMYVCTTCIKSGRIEKAAH